MLAKTALNEFCDWLSENKEYRQLFRRFRVFDGEEIALFDPADNS